MMIKDQVIPHENNTHETTCHTPFLLTLKNDIKPNDYLEFHLFL